MLCSECLTRIAELERLERIYAEAQDAFQKVQAEQPEDDALWVVVHRAKLDMMIARIELKRHQRQHSVKKEPGSETPPTSSAAVA
jgi:hypothetical protein